MTDKPTLDDDLCPCCRRPDCDAQSSYIDKLKERIAALEEECARLAASANTFADLADRLNEKLRQKTTSSGWLARYQRSRGLDLNASE